MEKTLLFASAHAFVLSKNKRALFQNLVSLKVKMSK